MAKKASAGGRSPLQELEVKPAQRAVPSSRPLMTDPLFDPSSLEHVQTPRLNVTFFCNFPPPTILITFSKQPLFPGRSLLYVATGPVQLSGRVGPLSARGAGTGLRLIAGIGDIVTVVMIAGIRDMVTGLGQG